MNISEVHAGEPSMHPDVISAMQLSIFRMAAEGLTDVQIGREVGLSQDTVKAHVSRAGKKLGATSRAHAVAVLFNAGLLSLNGAFDPAAMLEKVRIQRDEAWAENADLRRQLRSVRRDEEQRVRKMLAEVVRAS